jgi:hypothetical protein
MMALRYRFADHVDKSLAPLHAFIWIRPPTFSLPFTILQNHHRPLNLLKHSENRSFGSANNNSN